MVQRARRRGAKIKGRLKGERGTSEILKERREGRPKELENAAFALFEVKIGQIDEVLLYVRERLTQLAARSSSRQPFRFHVEVRVWIAESWESIC